MGGCGESVCVCRGAVVLKPSLATFPPDPAKGH